jgi:hypothetical protein
VMPSRKSRIINLMRMIKSKSKSVAFN